MYQHESVASLIYRTIKIKHFDSMGSFAAGWGTTLPMIGNNEFNDSVLCQIASWLQIENGKLYQETADYWRNEWGKKLYEFFVMKNQVKYCPECIKAEVYHKTIWSLVPITICDRHHVKLINCCQSCGHKITFDEFMFERCPDCFFTFADAVNELVEQDSVQYHSQKHLLNNLNKQYLTLVEKSFHLLSGLDSFVGSGRIHPFHNCNGGNRDTMALAFWNVFWMYENFPQNFNAVLNSFMQKPHQIKSLQKQEFEKLFKLTETGHIKAAYDQFWIKQYDHGVIRKNFSIFKSDGTLLQKANTMGKEQIKQEYGFSYPMIEKINPIKGGSDRRLYKKTDVQSFVKRVNEFVCIGQASAMLGIPVSSVQSLIKEGMLHLKITPSGSNALRRAEVQNLLDACSGTLVAGIIGTLSFKQVLDSHNVNKLTLARLLWFIMEGTLNPIKNKEDAKLCDLHFYEAEVKACVRRVKQKRVEESGYYASEVIQLLGIGEKTLQLLNSKGVLVPHAVIVMKHGRARRFYNKNQIDEFLTKNITIQTAANLYGISGSTIRRWLLKGDLHDVLYGCGKSYLINVRQLKQVMKKISF